MKRLSSFFRKAAPIPLTLEQRIAALSQDSPEVVLATALGSDKDELRVAAVALLPDGDVLRRLAAPSGEADNASSSVIPAILQRAAEVRVAVLIDAGSVDFARFCAQARNPSAMLSVAVLCKDANRLPQALTLIDDPAQVARLVVDSPSSRLRQLAAEAVEDPVQLRQLLKKVRGKDKTVYKILKQKCDAQNALDRRAAELLSEASTHCASLERHSHRVYDTLYAATFEQLNTRWRLLAAQPPEDLEQRAQQAIERCREVIESHLRQAARLAAAAAEQQAAQQAVRDIHERARQAAQEAAAAQADADAHLRKEAAAVLEAEEAARREKRAADEQTFGQIGGLIRKALGSLNDGNTQRAAGLRRTIDGKLSGAPAGAPALPPPLARLLQQLDDKLNELKQWKDYAVAPKRVELIDEMEGLIGSTDEPKLLAERIKSLQEEWRTISRGIVGDAPEEWERFHHASQTAYQPCREYFEAQARLRQENLEGRKTLLGRLAAFESTQSGENPDWRLVANVLREAPKEWRAHFPVDREAGKAVQADFDAAMGRLQTKLDAWYGRNVADKQSLITRARHLLTQDDSREAIEAVKRLQMLWKETGQAPRDLEQSLWGEFRELCDAIYKKRQQAYTEYAAGLEANKTAAVALCEEAERVAALSGPALLEAGAKIPEWRAAYQALGEMPRTDSRGLLTRFERALDLCVAHMAQQQARNAERSFTDLFEAARLVHAYQWAVQTKVEGSQRESLKQTAETFIANVQTWPKAGLQTIKETLAKTESASADSGESREKALRTLCIRCEIRSETATPVDDEALRRQYQVQRLMQGMGQGMHADDGDWDAMILEWVRLGAVAPDVHESLQERFMRCWIRRSKRISVA